MGKQIAEGGFSYVFEAFPVDDTNNNNNQSTNSRRMISQRSSSLTSVDTNNNEYGKRKYALKRINCADHEIIQSCRHEAGIHRSLPNDHPNLLELLGLKFDNDMNSSTTTSSLNESGGGRAHQQHREYNVCYMLFPYIPYSLRGEITKRNLLYDPSDYQSGSSRRQPFSTKEILNLFGGLIDAVVAMHNANISHRDIKLENVLLHSINGYGDHHHQHQSKRGKSSSTLGEPVLMDFGSAGSLTTELNTRQEVLTIVEESASNTTLPYRPPELFEGGLRHGPRKEVLDYGKVDVWSLGCVLFGLMHGTSPFEMEYSRGGSRNQQQNDQQYGLVRIVECTHLKILSEVPFPPWAGSGLGNNDGSNVGGNSRVSGGMNGKYPLSMYKFVRYMVHHDRNTRPNIQQVESRFGELYLQLMGERWVSYDEARKGGSGGRGIGKGGTNDDFDSLIASRDFV